jgi:hypothetical protein
MKNILEEEIYEQQVLPNHSKVESLPRAREPFFRQLLGNTFALVKGYSLGQQNHFQGNTRTQPFPREWMIILFLPWMKTIQNKDGNGKKVGTHDLPLNGQPLCHNIC